MTDNDGRQASMRVVWGSEEEQKKDTEQLLGELFQKICVVDRKIDALHMDRDKEYDQKISKSFSGVQGYVSWEKERIQQDIEKLRDIVQVCKKKICADCKANVPELEELMRPQNFYYGEQKERIDPDLLSEFKKMSKLIEEKCAKKIQHVQLPPT